MLLHSDARAENFVRRGALLLSFCFFFLSLQLFFILIHGEDVREPEFRKMPERAVIYARQVIIFSNEMSDV